MYFTQNQSIDIFLCLFILIGGNFFQRILSLQINLSCILVHIVFYPNSLPHSDPRRHHLSLNLTKNLITGTNNTLNPSFALILEQPWHEFVCFSLFFTVSFMFLLPGNFSFFPTGSAMYFVFATIVSEKIYSCSFLLWS